MGRAEELAAKYTERLKERGQKLVTFEPIDTLRIKRRVKGLDSSELLRWSDIASSGIGRCVLDYQEKKAPESLAEAAEACATLAEVIAELQRRHASP